MVEEPFLRHLIKVRNSAKDKPIEYVLEADIISVAAVSR